MIRLLACSERAKEPRLTAQVELPEEMSRATE